MNVKMICFSATLLSMVAGSALAAGQTGTSALDDPAKMQPFYTDSSMKTMVSKDAFTKAWKALSPEDQTAMVTACADEAKNANAANTHPQFCSSVKENGGSK